MTNKQNILILNGPNLNMLGIREPEIYGYDTLDDIEEACEAHSSKVGLGIDFQQFNSEGEMVKALQEARKNHSGIIINAAAYTHTSIAILDALLVTELPVIEVHLSNIYKREEFRHKSYVSQAATGSICGFGKNGYILALDAINMLLNNEQG